jgi:hypothetical protein
MDFAWDECPEPRFRISESADRLNPVKAQFLERGKSRLPAPMH